MLLHRGCSEERKAAFCWAAGSEGSDFSISPTTCLVTYFHVLFLQRPTTHWRHSHPLIFQDPLPILRAHPPFLFLAHKAWIYAIFEYRYWAWTKMDPVQAVLRKQVIYNPLPIIFLVKWQIILQSLAISWEATPCPKFMHQWSFMKTESYVK